MYIKIRRWMATKLDNIGWWLDRASHRFVRMAKRIDDNTDVIEGITTFTLKTFFLDPGARSSTSSQYTREELFENFKPVKLFPDLKDIYPLQEEED